MEQAGRPVDEEGDPIRGLLFYCLDLNQTDESHYEQPNSDATNMTRPVTQNHGGTALPAGTSAPDFGLHSTPDQIVKLSEFRGQPVVLAFYPADWSPVCGDQMALYNEMLSEFQKLVA